MTDIVSQLSRDVDALKGTGPCACKSTTPASTDATNKGVPPPGDAKGRYEVVDAGGSQWIVRDKRTGYMYVAHSHGWTNADHYSTFRVADIAEAVRDALERRT